MSARAVAPYRTLDGLAVQTLQPPLPAPGEVRAGKLRRLAALQRAARTRSHGPLPMQPRRWQRQVAEPAPTQMNGAQHCCEPYWPCCLDCYTCTGPSQLGGFAQAPRSPPQLPGLTRCSSITGPSHLAAAMSAKTAATVGWLTVCTSGPAGFVMLEAAGEDMPEEVLVLALHGRGITALESGDLQFFNQLRCYS